MEILCYSDSYLKECKSKVMEGKGKVRQSKGTVTGK